MKAKKNSVGLLAALLLVIVGGALVWNTTRGGDSEAQEQVATEAVYVTVQEIPVGTFVSDLTGDGGAAWVVLQEVPVDEIVPRAIRSASELEALAASGNVVGDVAVPAGSQLTLDYLIVPGTQETTGLGSNVPPNLFEVTIALESQRALGGNVVPGKEVAIVATFDADDNDPAQTVVVLDRVLVTNVETEAVYTPEQSGGDVLTATQAVTGRMYVTLGVPIEDLEKLTFAVETGRIWLAIQNEDATTDGSQIRDRDSVLGSNPSAGEGTAAATVEGEG